jgi:FtsH-binding integral membrane protein
LKEPVEVVIRGASALLALVIGIGLAFGLWLELHRVAEPNAFELAVVSLGAGLALIAVGLRYTAGRIFLAVLAVTLVLAFFGGGHAFEGLTS